MGEVKGVGKGNVNRQVSTKPGQLHRFFRTPTPRAVSRSGKLPKFSASAQEQAWTRSAVRAMLGPCQTATCPHRTADPMCRRSPPGQTPDPRPTSTASSAKGSAGGRSQLVLVPPARILDHPAERPPSIDHGVIKGSISLWRAPSELNFDPLGRDEDHLQPRHLWP